MEDNFKERISKYTLGELLDVEAGLDKERAPDKYACVIDEIARRRNAGEYVQQAYACPACKKLSISRCDKQKSGSKMKCRECGEQLYFDPNLSHVSAWIGITGVVLMSLYKSCLFFIAGVVAVILLRDKWIKFVSKDVYIYRSAMNELIILIVSGLISLSFTLWSVSTDPSNVPNHRGVFIAFCAVSTVVLIGAAVRSLKKIRKLKH